MGLDWIGPGADRPEADNQPGLNHPAGLLSLPCRFYPSHERSRIARNCRGAA